jgi:hypothetical protein
MSDQHADMLERSMAVRRSLSRVVELFGAGAGGAGKYMWSDELECTDEMEGLAALAVEENDARGPLNEDMDTRGSLAWNWKYDCCGPELVADVGKDGDVYGSKIGASG